MSFIIGISRERIYGLMGVKGATDSVVIVSYLSDMLKQRNADPNLKDKPFVLSMDNASVHVSEKTQKFLARARLRAIAITTSCPSLNPTEKIIDLFKTLLVKNGSQEGKT